MKIRFLFILLFILSAAGPVRAQYFNKRYTLHSAGNVFTNALLKNNKIYAASVCIDSSNYLGGDSFKNIQDLKFTILDLEGNLLYTKLHHREEKICSYISSSNNMVPYGDSFIIAFSAIDTAKDPYLPGSFACKTVVAVFDSLGNLGTYREYTRTFCSIIDSGTYFVWDFKAVEKGCWVMLSSRICEGQTECNLRKLDADFNTIWDYNFEMIASNNNPQNVLVEKDGYVICGGLDNRNLSTYLSYCGSFLIKCDTAGKLLWTWRNRFSTDSLQSTANDVVRTGDGGYTYCGTGFGYPNLSAGSKLWLSASFYGFVEKLDANRNSVWKTKIGAYSADAVNVTQMVLKELPGGDIVVAGGIKMPVPGEEEQTWFGGCLSRLDGKTGNIIWQRIYKSPDGNDTMFMYFFDMRRLDDGGFLMAGVQEQMLRRPYLLPWQRSWLVRVDSNGCLGPDDPQCNPTALREQKMSADFRVYPNPAGNELFVFNPAGDAAAFCLSDVNGKTVAEKVLRARGKTVVDIAALAPGMYFYSINIAGSPPAVGKLLKN